MSKTAARGIDLGSICCHEGEGERGGTRASVKRIVGGGNSRVRLCEEGKKLGRSKMQ